MIYSDEMEIQSCTLLYDDFIVNIYTIGLGTSFYNLLVPFHTVLYKCKLQVLRGVLGMKHLYDMQNLPGMNENPGSMESKSWGQKINIDCNGEDDMNHCFDILI
jgi:hypothetical protein